MIRGVISGFSSGQDSFDELFAEGCVALHSAAMNFDIRQTQVTFGLYARICVYNRMVDFIRFEKKSEEVVDYDVDTVADDGTSIEAHRNTENYSGRDSNRNGYLLLKILCNDRSKRRIRRPERMEGTEMECSVYYKR